MNNLSGGKCPENQYQGFFQKTGQCWLDAISMVLIYGGRTSNTIIQGILAYEPSSYGSKLKDDKLILVRNPGLIERKIEENKEMIPINIEEADYKDFIKFGERYLYNLQARLKQTFQNTAENINMSSQIDYSNQMGSKLSGTVTKAQKTQEIHRIILDKFDNPMPIPVLSRQASFDYSIQCNHDIISISQLNDLRQPIVGTKLGSGGLNRDTIWTIYFYNFLFLSPINHIKPLHYIDNTRDLLRINYNNININEIFAIIVNIRILDEIGNQGDLHSISFFKCKISDDFEHYWIYDDNGFNVLTYPPLVEYDWFLELKAKKYLELPNFLHYNNFKIKGVLNLGFDSKDSSEYKFYFHETYYKNERANNMQSVMQLFNDVIPIPPLRRSKRLQEKAQQLSSAYVKEKSVSVKRKIDEPEEPEGANPKGRSKIGLKYLKYKMKYLNLKAQLKL